MDDDDHPAGVPRPREGGREPSGYPFVPGPRSAPAVESLPRSPGSVATMTERAGSDRTTSTALVRTDRGSSALAVRPEDVATRLRSWGLGVVRVVARVVGAAVAGLRSVVDALVPCPAGR